jgi:3-hydroxyisobutyrate dehydrogenase-like beta-hydroxyacid dehydrogenase
MNALERAGSKRQQLVDGDTKARFSAAALLKDLRLAHGVRQGLRVDAPVMDSVLAEFESVVNRGVGGDDYIAVALSLERD